MHSFAGLHGSQRTLRTRSRLSWAVAGGPEQLGARKGGCLRPASGRGQDPGALQVAVGFPKLGLPTSAHCDCGTQQGRRRGAKSAVKKRQAGRHVLPPAVRPLPPGGGVHVRRVRRAGTPGALQDSGSERAGAPRGAVHRLSEKASGQARAAEQVETGTQHAVQGSQPVAHAHPAAIRTLEW